MVNQTDRGFEHMVQRRPDISTDSYPQALAGGKLPLAVSVESSNVYTSGNVDTLCQVIDVL